MTAAPKPPMGRAVFDAIPAGTELLRSLRFLPPDQFDELTDLEVDTAARWLRAAAYSATEGARRLEAILTRRTESTLACSSDPPNTPPASAPPPPLSPLT